MFRALIGYIFGFVSCMLIIGSLCGESGVDIYVAIAISVILLVSALLIAYHHHKRKRQEYYDKIKNAHNNW